MMQYQTDVIELKTDKITTGNDEIHGETTVFHDVPIASEIVNQYSDGMAWKPREELEAYAPYVEGRWVILGGHPDTSIISDREQVHGRTTNVRFVKNLKNSKDKRPNRAGVVADIEIFNEKAPPELLEDMKNGLKRDVSIGFFFFKDETPGEWNGDTYDYVQRNMFHDHTAAAIDQGRCPYPYCGIGADELAERLVGDPFAGFKDFAECKRKIAEKNPDLSEESVEKICGSLKAKYEDRVMEDDLVKYASKILRQVMDLSHEIEALKGERDALKEMETEKWWKQINWKEDEYTTIFDHLTEETRQLIIEAGLCPNCDEEKEDEECPEGHEKDPETGECVPIEEEEDVKLTLPKDKESHKKPKAQKKDESFEELIARGDKTLASVEYERE